MRIAIISDIHGNLTALEAVLADLKFTAPDLILHGGDLAHSGPNPAAVVDQIQALGWRGVLGNTDEMLFRPESLTEFACQSTAPPSLFQAIAEMAQSTRETLGEARLAWLATLPQTLVEGPLALVHACPTSLWRSILPEASDETLTAEYAPLSRLIVVYAHIHRSFIRSVGSLTVANTGSVSLSHDGDPRASYLLLDDETPTIRRVHYDVERTAQALATSQLPHADWVIRILRAAKPLMP